VGEKKSAPNRNAILFVPKSVASRAGEQLSVRLSAELSTGWIVEFEETSLKGFFEPSRELNECLFEKEGKLIVTIKQRFGFGWLVSVAIRETNLLPDKESVEVELNDDGGTGVISVLCTVFDPDNQFTGRRLVTCLSGDQLTGYKDIERTMTTGGPYLIKYEVSKIGKASLDLRLESEDGWVIEKSIPVSVTEKPPEFELAKYQVNAFRGEKEYVPYNANGGVPEIVPSTEDSVSAWVTKGDSMFRYCIQV